MNKFIVPSVVGVASVVLGCYLYNNETNIDKFVHDICLSAGGIYSEKNSTYYSCYNSDAVKIGMWHKEQVATAIADVARYKKIKELSR